MTKLNICSVQSLEIINPDSGILTKKQVADKLAKVINLKNSECITIFGMKAKFGGGRTSAFALVYDSVESKTKYDSTTGLRRVSNVINCIEGVRTGS